MKKLTNLKIPVECNAYLAQPDSLRNVYFSIKNRPYQVIPECQMGNKSNQMDTHILDNILVLNIWHWSFQKKDQLKFFALANRKIKFPQNKN